MAPKLRSSGLTPEVKGLQGTGALGCCSPYHTSPPALCSPRQWVPSGAPPPSYLLGLLPGILPAELGLFPGLPRVPQQPSLMTLHAVVLPAVFHNLPPHPNVLGLGDGEALSSLWVLMPGTARAHTGCSERVG